jgi:hypothetical protein
MENQKQADTAPVDRLVIWLVGSTRFIEDDMTLAAAGGVYRHVNTACHRL